MITIYDQKGYEKIVNQIIAACRYGPAGQLDAAFFSHALKTAANDAEVEVTFDSTRRQKPGHPVPPAPAKLHDLTTDEITDLVAKAVRGAFSSEVFANGVKEVMIMDAQNEGEHTKELWRALIRRIMGEV